MKNYLYKAPIIIMMVCFFLFFIPYNNAHAIISEYLSNEEIDTAHKCTLTIDADKHIADINIFAEANGVCSGQVQGYYLKANDSFNIIGAVNEFVNYDGEKFDFVVEPSGETAIVTVRLIERSSARHQHN